MDHIFVLVIFYLNLKKIYKSNEIQLGFCTFESTLYQESKIQILYHDLPGNSAITPWHRFRLPSRANLLTTIYKYIKHCNKHNLKVVECNKHNIMQLPQL